MDHPQTLHIAVVSTNVTFALLLLGAAWRIRTLKTQLVLWSEAIDLTDARLSQALANSPSQLADQTARLRQFQELFIRWQTNLKRLQQILWLLNAGIRIMRK